MLTLLILGTGDKVPSHQLVDAVIEEVKPPLGGFSATPEEVAMCLRHVYTSIIARTLRNIQTL